MLVVLMCAVLTQVPQTPVIDTSTATRVSIGPTLPLYVSPGPGSDGGVIRSAEWRFSPTVDGGVVASGPQSNTRYLYLPAQGALTAQLPECQPVTFEARFLNDAGSSGWSAPAGPSVWDSLKPPALSGGNLTSLTSTGPVDLAFTEVIDGCSSTVDYPVFWTLADRADSGVSDDGPYPAASPARLTMGPGPWRVSLATRDLAGNSTARVALGGVVTILPSAGVIRPPLVRLIGAPWFNDGATSASWGAVAGAAGYVVLLTLADGGVPLWVRRSTDRSITVYPLVSDAWLDLQVATIAPDGGVSDWTHAEQPLYVESDPPSTPTALAATWTGGSVTLNWAPSVDAASGVVGYEVEAATMGAFAPIGAPVAPTLTTPAVTANWRFRVRALDAAGNESPFSTTTSLFVDLTAPPVPSPPVPTPASGSLMLAWNAVLDLPDASTPVVYALERSLAGASAWATVDPALPGPSAIDAPAEGAWEYRVSAIDAFGNASAPSSPGPVAIVRAGDADAGERNGEPPLAHRYSVGCGCSSSVGAVGWCMAVLLRRRRPDARVSPTL